MAAFRGTIPDFQTANPIYAGARVTFFTVDANGVSTGTQATLYAEPTGTQTALNPQTLDGEGKFQAPVYTDVPVIAEVVGANVGSHTVGPINPRGTWRGDWAAGTRYYINDFYRDPVSGNIYIVARDHVAGASPAVDKLAGNVETAVDQAAIISGGAAQAIKVAAHCATTGNIALSGLQVVDDYQTVAGTRVLVKDNTLAAENGLWNAAAGAWTRCVDMDEAGKFATGCIVYVTNGTLSRNKGYQLSIPTPFTLGTTPVMWTAIEVPQSSIPVRFVAPIDGLLVPGQKGYAHVAHDCEIERWTVIGDQVGSIVIEIRKCAYAAFPSTVSITGAAKPTLSNQQAAQDTTLPGWTTQLLQGDVLEFEILSVSALRAVNLDLRVNRN